jgi:hypothetical protein
LNRLDDIGDVLLTLQETRVAGMLVVRTQRVDKADCR